MIIIQYRPDISSSARPHPSLSEIGGDGKFT